MNSVLQKEPVLYNCSFSRPLRSGRGFSPTETVGGSTDPGVPAGGRKSGTLTTDPGEPGADSGLPDFPSGAGAADLVLRFGIVKPEGLNFEKNPSGFFGAGGWSGIRWPLRSGSAGEPARTRKNHNVPFGVQVRSLRKISGERAMNRSAAGSSAISGSSHSGDQMQVSSSVSRPCGSCLPKQEDAG